METLINPAADRSVVTNNPENSKVILKSANQPVVVKPNADKPDIKTVVHVIADDQPVQPHRAESHSPKPKSTNFVTGSGLQERRSFVQSFLVGMMTVFILLAIGGSAVYAVHKYHPKLNYHL
jgi:hypothetical protein